MIRRLAAVANPRTLKIILQAVAVAAACEMSEKLVSGECIIQSILVDIVEIVMPSAHNLTPPQTLQKLFGSHAIEGGEGQESTTIGC